MLSVVSTMGALALSVPSIMSAEEGISLKTTVTVDRESARTADVTVNGVPSEYVKVKVQGIDEDIEIKNGGFECTVSILDANGDISTEPISLDVTFFTEDGNTAEGTLVVDVIKSSQYENVSLEAETIEFDWSAPGEYVEKYKDGVTTLIEGIPEGIGSISVFGVEYDVENNSATITVPCSRSEIAKFVEELPSVPEDVIVPQDAIPAGIYKTDILLSDEEGVEHQGSLSFDVKVAGSISNAPVEIEAGVIEVDLSSPDTYSSSNKDGLPVTLQFADNAITSVTFNNANYPVENGKATVYLPSTRSNSVSFETDYEYIIPEGYVLPNDVVLEGDYCGKITLKASDNYEQEGTLSYTIKWVNMIEKESSDPNEPEVPLEPDEPDEPITPPEEMPSLEFTLSEPVLVMDGDLKKDNINAFIEKYSNGTEIIIEELPSSLVSVEANGNNFSIFDGKAKLTVPVIDDKGNAFKGEIPLEFKDTAGNIYQGSIFYFAEITEPQKEAKTTLTIASDVSVKCNGNLVSTGCEIKPGDVLEFAVQERRGQKPEIIISSSELKNIHVEYNSDGTFDSFTVPEVSDIEISVSYKEAESYTISLVDCVEAYVIGANANIPLDNGAKIYDGEKIKINAISPEGYSLNSLKLNGSSIQNGAVVTVNGTDISVTADFGSIARRIITFPEDVTVVKVSNNAELKTGVALAEGEKIKISASKDGYVLTSLTVNDREFVNGSIFTVGSGDVDIETEYSESEKDATKFPVTIEIIDENYDSSIRNVTLDVLNQSNAVIATAVTDKDGEICIELAPGKYSFIVKDAPEGYIYSSESKSFSVSDAGVVRGATSMEIAISSVTISRNDPTTNAPIIGETISVYNKDGEIVFTGKTDKNGKMIIEGLAPGKYTYKIRASASGYSMDSSVYSFAIAEDGKVTGTVSGHSNANNVVITVVDETTGAGVKGAVIAVKNPLGVVIASLSTDASGKVTIENLSPGSYYITQTSTATGYTYSETPYVFTVLDSGAVSGTTMITNKSKSSETSTQTKPDTNKIQSDTITGSQESKPSTISSSTSSSTISTGSTTSSISTGNSSSISTIKTNITTDMKDVIKTGVEVEETKNVAPVVAGIIGGLAAIGAAAVAIIKKIKK